MLVLLLPRVSSRVSGFPVASPCLWGKLQNFSFSKVSNCENWRTSRTKCSFSAPTCLVSSLWFSCGFAVSMGEAAKPLLFEGFQAGCDVVLRGRRGALWHSNLFYTVSKILLCGWRNNALHTLHFTLYTLHSTLYTPPLHSTLNTLHSTLHTPPRATLYTLHTPHSTLYTPHSSLYTPHSITPHPTLHTLHFPLHTPHSTLYHLTLHLYTSHPHFTLHFTLYTSHSTLYTPHSTLYTPHATLHHTLHFTHSTLLTAHFTLHTPHFTLHTLHSTLLTLHSTLHTPHLPLHTADLEQGKYVQDCSNKLLQKSVLRDYISMCFDICTINIRVSIRVRGLHLVFFLLSLRFFAIFGYTN